MGVGTRVGGKVPGVATTLGVGVGAGSVGRGVSRFAGLSDVGVGAGPDGATTPHGSLAALYASRNAGHSSGRTSSLNFGLRLSTFFLRIWQRVLRSWLPSLKVSVK